MIFIYFLIKILKKYIIFITFDNKYFLLLMISKQFIKYFLIKFIKYFLLNNINYS